MTYFKFLCPSPESFSEKGLKLLAKYVRLDEIKLSQKTFEERAPKYDGLIIRFNTIIDKKIINKNSKVKWIICPTTGLNHIDLDLCRINRVKILSLKKEKNFLKEINSTAELTMSLILNLSRKIIDARQSVLNSQWKFQKFRGNDLYNKNLGIIGLGRLGKKVMRYSKSFGMNIFYYDPYIKKTYRSVTKVNNINILIKKSDIITIHVPLNSKTENLISYKEFMMMKKNCFIINTSRSKIIDELSLIKFLKEKKIQGAALDVINDELTKDLKKNKLLNFAKKNTNLLITPHIGGSTFESVEKTDIYLINKFLSLIH